MYFLTIRHFLLKYGRVFIILVLSLAVISCDSSDDIPIQKVDDETVISNSKLQQGRKKQQQNTYYFGFDLRNSPQEDAAQYLPFLKYLEKATGYHFKLYFTSKDSSAGKDLGLNKTQFAAMGAMGFLETQENYDVISLVRGINHQNKAEYQSVLVVKPDSPISDIKNIKGSKLAFGSKNSTQGHLIPRIMLTKNDILLEDLDTYTFTGSHQNCAEAVVSGHYDVCGMQDQLAKKLVIQGILKIIHSSDYYPSSGIVVNRSVSVEVAAKIKQALLDFKPRGIHSEGLYHWDSTEMPGGFISANENDYKNLRQWALQLGFLHPNGTKVQEKPQ